MRSIVFIMRQGLTEITRRRAQRTHSSPRNATTWSCVLTLSWESTVRREVTWDARRLDTSVRVHFLHTRRVSLLPFLSYRVSYSLLYTVPCEIADFGIANASGAASPVVHRDSQRRVFTCDSLPTATPRRFTERVMRQSRFPSEIPSAFEKTLRL